MIRTKRNKTRIKICGIKEQEDAFICIDQGVHALGFIFYPKSPRYIMPKEAKKIIASLPCFVSRVGVFVDEKEDKIRELAEFTGLDTVQLHGKESPAFCNRLKRDFKVIKSFFPKNGNIREYISKYKVDCNLLDIPLEDKQAKTISVLDSKLLRQIIKDLGWFILSGGLTPENIKGLLKEFKPYAVDVARGVERFPGKKDKNLVKRFVRAVESFSQEDR